VQVINMTDSDVRELMFNDTAAALLGGETMALRVLNAVGLSPLGNDVAVQPAPDVLVLTTADDSSRELMLGLSIGLPLLVIVLLLLALLYYLRRWRRDTVVNFPKPDEWELDREQVRTAAALCTRNAAVDTRTAVVVKDWSP